MQIQRKKQGGSPAVNPSGFIRNEYCCTDGILDNDCELKPYTDEN